MIPQKHFISRLVLLFAMVTILRSAAAVAETPLRIVKSVIVGHQVEGQISDFTFCRNDDGPFILYSTGQPLVRLDYATEVFGPLPFSTLTRLAAPPDCTRIFSATLLNPNLMVEEKDGVTGELIEGFTILAEEFGIDGSVGNVIDIALNPQNGHLFLFAFLLGGEPGILEFDWDLKEIVRAMPLPEEASEVQVHPAFAIHPETEDLFLELPALENEQRRVGRFAPDGTLLEIFLLPDSEGLAIDPATNHLFVYVNRSDGHGFFELAPVVVNAVGEEWERYE